jgi:hypothetical protein
MRFALLASALVLCAACSAGGESHTEFADVSAFGALDQKKLDRLTSGGDILIEVNSSMKFERGISMQACYALPQSPEAIAQLLQKWDASSDPTLEVYQHHTFHNAADAHFDTLKFNTKIAPFQRLLRAMQKPDELQLSEYERLKIGVGSHDAESARRFWAKALEDRWSAVEFGGVPQLPDYVQGNKKYSVMEEFRILKSEEPLIRKRFSEDSRAQPPTSPLFYWSVSKVDTLAAVNMGSIKAQDCGDHWQVIDTNFYVSSGYLGSITFYELWPLTIAGKPQALVWQTDLVSAPGLAGALGLKRKIASLLIQSDVKETVEALRKAAMDSR